LTELAADLPQVKADRIELQQVVMNLIINGIESMRNTDRARELAIELLRSETGKVPVSVGDARYHIPAITHPCPTGWALQWYDKPVCGVYGQPLRGYAWGLTNYNAAK
jgi:hypothetical protein